MEEAAELSAEEFYNLSDPNSLVCCQRFEKNYDIILQKETGARNLLWIAATSRQALSRARSALNGMCQGLVVQTKSFSLPECHAVFLKRHALAELKAAGPCSCDIDFATMSPNEKTGERMSQLVLSGNRLAIDETTQKASSILRKVSTMSVHITAPNSLCQLLVHNWASMVETIEKQYEVAICNGSPHSQESLEGPTYYESESVDLSDAGVEAALGQEPSFSELVLDVTSLDPTKQRDAGKALLEITRSLVRESFQISMTEAEQLNRRLCLNFDAVFKLCKVSAGVNLSTNTMVLVAASSFAAQKAKAQILEWLRDGTEIIERNVHLEGDPLAARIVLTINWEKTRQLLGSDVHVAKLPGTSDTVRIMGDASSVDRVSHQLKEKFRFVKEELEEEPLTIAIAHVPALLMPEVVKAIKLFEDEYPIQWLYSAEDIQQFVSEMRPSLVSRLDNGQWPDGKLLGVTASANGHQLFQLRVRGLAAARSTAKDKLNALLASVQGRRESVVERATLNQIDVQTIEKVAMDMMVDVEMRDIAVAGDTSHAKVVAYGVTAAISKFWAEVNKLIVPPQ